jgi:hypothetical protein
MNAALNAVGDVSIEMVAYLVIEFALDGRPDEQGPEERPQLVPHDRFS